MARRWTTLFGLLVLVAFSSPLLATDLQQEALKPGDAPALDTGEVLVEAEEGRFFVALDRYGDSGAGDGLADQTITFETREEITPFTFQGVGLVRLDTGSLHLSLPELGMSYLLVVEDEQLTVQSRGDATVRYHGTSLGTWSPPSSLEKPLALALEAARERVGDSEPLESLGESLFQQDPDSGGSGSCKTSCAVGCADGSECEITCASGRCAECDCVPTECVCKSA